MAKEYNITLLAFMNRPEQAEDSFYGFCLEHCTQPVLLSARLKAFLKHAAIPYITQARIACGRSFAEKWKAANPHGVVWDEFTPEAMFVEFFKKATKSRWLSMISLTNPSTGLPKTSFLICNPGCHLRTW